MSDLRGDLSRLDGRAYPAYRDLRGRRYDIERLAISLDHVQGDPFAAPSRVSVRLGHELTAFPAWARATAGACRATADFVHRAVLRALRAGQPGAGSGRSGQLEIVPVGQEVLERTAVCIDPSGGALIRLTAGLPAAGRRILGREAIRLLVERLPASIRAALSELRGDELALRRHVEAVEDQIALREQLGKEGMVAFLADGSLLPRRSGADDRPLAGGRPLRAPAGLACTLEAPHGGRLRGLAIPRGVTLVVGGGYHGKSTLLSALARGVYDHVPGDGRERCVTLSGAVSIRAEDGRAVHGVDLRPFIRDLPLGRGTRCFDSDDASGSTSQAAAIVEALEIGAELLLIDEDTAATNFMIRDPRMRRLVPAAKEPITPYLDRVRQLATEHGVSSVLVVGGAGDYLDVADTVIQMDSYEPFDVTAEAREVARALPLGEAAPHPPGPWSDAAPRVPDPGSLDPSRGRRAERVRGVKTRAIEFGSEEIDVSLLSQLVDPAQCRMIGDALLQMSRGWCDGSRSVRELVDLLESRIIEGGLESVTAPGFGDRARARRFEIAAALNRLRSLRLR